MQHLNPAVPHAGRLPPTHRASGQVCAALGQDSLCMPCALARADSEPASATRRRRIRRRAELYRQEGTFSGIWVVLAGSFKSVLQLDDGSEQVVGFHVSGDVLGLDGLARGRHESSAIALEDSELVPLPVPQPGEAAAAADLLPKLLSREFVRERQHWMLLNQQGAEARVAAFLLDLSERMHARGYSASEFNLRLTREEMGSYLGLSLETVSRAFSSLRSQGVLLPNGRHVRVTDLAGLRQAAGASLAIQPSATKQ